MIKSAADVSAMIDSASPDTRDADIVVLGGSICAWMIADYLQQKLANLKIIVLGPTSDQEKRPIVGESLVEPAAIFFNRIGLGKYLEREHAVKFGLSFYHKLNLKNPADRRYSVHAPQQLLHLSRQLHRPRFDDDLRDHALSLNVENVNGKAREIEIGPGATRHRIVAEVAGKPTKLECRWVIDATGRQRWLGRRVSSYDRPKERQRNCFWFRLADFKPFSNHVESLMRRPLKYDLWYTTHHFMGRGNWVWGIPLASKEYEKLISVGITYRPDLFPRPIKSVDDFLDQLDTEHPAVADMVRSGTVLDTNIYNNFLYCANQIYSSDGWFLVGDAARSVDPLYSTGLSMTVIQIEQIGEIISCQLESGITEDEIQILQKLWLTITGQSQDEISDQYAIMHDPFQACMRRYWNVCGYFNGILPLWWNGLLHDVEAAKTLYPLFERGRAASTSARRLMASASKQIPDDLTQADFDRTVDFDWLINPHFDCPSAVIPDQFGRLQFKRAAFRWSLLRAAKFQCALSQLPAIGFELLLSKILPVYLRWAMPRVFSRGSDAACKGIEKQQIGEQQITASQ